MGAASVIPKFEDALEVTPLDDGRNWRVDAPFYYDTNVRLSGIRPKSVVVAFHDASGGDEDVWTTRIPVPAGFVTDFASIPRVFWRMLPPTGRYTRAAVVHDRLYRTFGLCTRAQADAVLYEAMKYPCRVDFLTRWIIYLGVRLGGALSYKGGL